MESINNKMLPRVARVFELLELNGNNLGMPFSKNLGGKLFELRIIGHAQIRFIYTFYKGKVWMLNGFEKKVNRIPIRELSYAKEQLKVL